MLRRCNTCGNYFESNTGICSICGANNLAPGERFVPPKRPVKKIIAKKKSIWPFVILMFLIVLIAAGVILYNINNPKYANDNIVKLSGDIISKPTNILPKTKGTVETSKNTKNTNEVSISYKNADQVDINRYGEYLKERGFIPFSQQKGLGYIKVSSVDVNKVLVVSLGCSNESVCFANFKKTIGKIDHYVTGNNFTRVGNSSVGYITLTDRFSHFENSSNPLIYKEKENRSIIALSVIRNADTKNFSNFQNKVVAELNIQLRKNAIKNLAIKGINLGDSEGFMVSYNKLPSKELNREYYIYIESLKEVRKIVIKTADDLSKYQDLISSYYMEYSNNKNQSIQING